MGSPRLSCHLEAASLLTRFELRRSPALRKIQQEGSQESGQLFAYPVFA
jgi:hypothetical protein